MRVTAMQIREDSWDAARHMRYGKSFRTATQEAIPNDARFADLAYILTAVAWNDAAQWAEEVLQG